MWILNIFDKIFLFLLKNLKFVQTLHHLNQFNKNRTCVYIYVFKKQYVEHNFMKNITSCKRELWEKFSKT